MDTAQLVIFFIVGFLLSRATIAVGLADAVLRRLEGPEGIRLGSAAVLLTASAAAFSLLVPNMVTVMTILPVVTRLVTRTAPLLAQRDRAAVATMLSLAVIYGANIGGMGSITATPANGILIAFLVTRDVAGRHEVHFLSWLLWGLPLVIAVTALACGLLLVVFRPWRYRLAPGAAERLAALPLADPLALVRQRRVSVLAAIYFAAALGLSAAMLRWNRPAMVLGLSGALGLLLAGGLFLWPVDSSEGRRPLLAPRDCISEIPHKGLGLMGAAVGLAGLLYALGAHTLLGQWLVRQLPAGANPWLLAFLLALVTSFLTEVLSNTAVQLVLLALVEPMAGALPLSMLKLGTIITLSCTCAFMSPIATGVNGLAFGGVAGASVWRMLGVGLLMNGIAAAVISAYVVAFVW